MTTSLEREIKLRFASPAEARVAVSAAGATRTCARRLQQDYVLDTVDEILHHRRSALRVRMENDECRLTFKGPPLRSTMKLREELETSVGNGATLLRVLEKIGFQVSFRYEKYREEFTLGDVVLAIDETPLGTFVELEGGKQGIDSIAHRLGRTPADYVTDSYRALFLRHREEHGLADIHMTFGTSS